MSFILHCIIDTLRERERAVKHPWGSGSLMSSTSNVDEAEFNYNKFPHLTAQKLITEAQDRHDLQEVCGLQRVLEITHVEADFGCVNEVYNVL